MIHYLPASLGVVSPVSPQQLMKEEREVIEGRQLRQDIQHTSDWLNKIEVLSTTSWASPISGELSSLVRSCRQYNVCPQLSQCFC